MDTITKASGPTWQWLTGVLLGIILTVMGSLIGWIAITVYNTSLEVARLSVEVASLNSQVSFINTAITSVNIQQTKITKKIIASAQQSDNNNDWIQAHVLADRAIKKAEQAKHPRTH